MPEQGCPPQGSFPSDCWAGLRPRPCAAIVGRGSPDPARVPRLLGAGLPTPPVCRDCRARVSRPRPCAAIVGAGLPTPPECPTEGLPPYGVLTEHQRLGNQGPMSAGDLRSGTPAGSGDPANRGHPPPGPFQFRRYLTLVSIPGFQYTRERRIGITQDQNAEDTAGKGMAMAIGLGSLRPARMAGRLEQRRAGRQSARSA